MKRYANFRSRLAIACWLLLAEVVCRTALHFTPRNDEYYIVCSVFNLAVLLSLPLVVHKDIVIDFQYLNLTGFALQGVGFFSYWYEVPIGYYNWSIHILNVVQVIRLFLYREGDMDDFAKDNNGWSVVRHYNSYCFKILHKEKVA